MQQHIAVVICAAGSSNRMGGQKKEYMFLPSLSQKPLTVIGAAVSAFTSCPQVGPIVISIAPQELSSKKNSAQACLPGEILNREGGVFFVPGGATRRASVENALLFLKQLNPSYVLIHDGARPWIKLELIENCIKTVIRCGAVIPVLPLLETPKEVFSPDGDLQFIKRHLKRSEIYSAQTPQCFSFPEILLAHEKAREREEKEFFEYTDDAEVWGEFVGKVAVIPGDPENKKITYPEDLGR